jgi:cold shock CspA family protein
MPRPTRVPAAIRRPTGSGAGRTVPGDPPAPRVTGRITKIIRSRACGFIRTTDGQDVFFHVSDLGEVAMHELDERLVVQFDLVADAISGPRATQVQIVRPKAPAAPRRPRVTRAATSAAHRSAR